MQYTISQILEIAKSGFNEIFGEFTFLCVAEVVGCKYGKKAVFLECIEYDTSGDVKAKCTVCIFNKNMIDDFFEKTLLTKETIVGQQILLHGHLSVYEDRINIIADTISSSFTLGQLQQAQKNIIDVLKKDGILHKNKETNLGYPQYNFAIISSENSDGLEDFLTVLEQENIPFTYTLYNTLVHGNAAKEAVYKSLQAIYTDIKKGIVYNAVCVIRGGGDTAGILRQNDIDIARGICYMPIPVLVAVGHTKDSTILDEVSFAVPNTPTAAAHMVAEYTNDFKRDIEKNYTGVLGVIDKTIISYYTGINNLYEKITGDIARRYNDIGKMVEYYWNTIQIYDPQNILEKGYAILRQENTVLGSKIPQIGKHIDIETSLLHIVATVESVATKE